MTKEEQIFGLARQGDDATDILAAALRSVITPEWTFGRVLGALTHLAAMYARACDLSPDEWRSIAGCAYGDAQRYDKLQAIMREQAGQALGAQPTDRGPAS